MTGKDILISLGDIDPKYYIEGEEGTLTINHSRVRKSVLIAAVIALAAVLVGCAVVYALRLQDMSIGTETYTQSFDENGKAIDPVEKTRDILTLYGHSGDAIQSAMKEWYAFTESYDPDGELMDNIPDHPEIPNSFEWTYSCYTLEMADKLQEIANKYNLKLLEEWIPFQVWQGGIFLEETGVGSLARPDSGAEVTRISGMFYPPQNFNMDFELALDGFDSKIWGRASYARKDYFPRDFPGGMDLSLFDQWDYTAADGTKLLLALSNKGSAYIIAQPENAMLIYWIDGNFSGSAYPTAEKILTKKQLEQIADVFDYSVQPHDVDRVAVQAKLDAAQAEYDAEHTYEEPQWGDFSQAMKEKFYRADENAQYAFFDLTGDGTEELLLDEIGNGTIREWYTVQNGQVECLWGNDNYLCEGRVLDSYDSMPEYDQEYHCYTKADTDTAWMDLDQESHGDLICILTKRNGQWYYATDYNQDGEQITAEEAQAIMDKYPRIEIDWKPAMEYPISETQTVRDYLNEKDVRVSHEELMQLYREQLTKRDNHYSHYRILDINGDGVEDLLLKGENDSLIGNTDFYWVALTYRYGLVQGLDIGDFYLCEDGVLEHVETRHKDIGVEIDGHEFVRLKDFRQETLGFAAYNKADASWQSDWKGTPITESEANATLSQYPRIDQGMRPISELLN